jgi:predicted dehydrogenase
VPSKLRIGLVGCGRIAQLIHLRVLAGLPDAELIALADADPVRLQEAHGQVRSARLFTHYHELYEQGGAEAVVICLPSHLHAAAAIAAFQQGLHAYVEKPVATTLEDGTRLLQSWHSNGRVGMVGFNFRLHPLYQKARKALTEGRIGLVVGAVAVFSSAAQMLPPWKQDPRTGGGVLLDLASHLADRVRFLFEQEVQEVSAALRSVRTEADSASVHLRLANGILVQGFLSMSTIEEDRMEIYGDAGKLAFDRYRSTGVEVVPPRVWAGRAARLGRCLAEMGQVPRRSWNQLSPPRDPSFRAALQTFVHAAQTGLPAKPDIMDGIRSLAVVLALEEAARTGQLVRVAGFDS